ncbi:hypothetical protein EVJ58_g7882, partial [Rhodofomes roseus]
MPTRSQQKTTASKEPPRAISSAQTTRPTDAPKVPAQTTRTPVNDATIPSSGRASPNTADARSFADVIAGRPATPPQHQEEVPPTPRLQPEAGNGGDIPHLELPSALITQNEQTASTPVPQDEPTTVNASRAGTPSAVRSMEFIVVRNKKKNRKHVEAKQLQEAALGHGTPPPTLAQQPSQERAVSNQRKRRRTSKERVDDGGEASQPQPTNRVQTSPANLSRETSRTMPTGIPSKPLDGPLRTAREPAQAPQSPHHTSIMAEWDSVNGGFIWNPPPMNVDPLWRPNGANRAEGSPRPEPTQSDVGSYYAASFDDMIRSYTSPPPGLLTLTPTPVENAAALHTTPAHVPLPEIVPARMPPHVGHASGNVLENSALAPPWSTEPGQLIQLSQEETRPAFVHDPHGPSRPMSIVNP